MARNRIVIVGNSAAGLSALETIRRLDRDCPISLISDEELPAYSRVLLPHYVSGEVGDVFIRSMDYYRRMGVKTVFGSKAVTAHNGSVTLDDGRTVPYDRLLIATGSSAAVPDIPGARSPGVFAVKTRGDAEEIRRRVSASPRALIVGGGLICLLMVRAFRKLGLRLSLVVSSDRLLSRMLDGEGARLVQARLEAAGVDVHTRTDVAEIASENGAVSGVVSRAGRTFPAGLVVIAKGIRSNVGLAERSGIATARGILVDQYMRTSAENVYAAGDAAESKDLIVKGKRTVCGTWFEAVFQGEIAGCNMAGVKRPTLGSLKMNVMEAEGLAVASIGMLEAPDGTGDAVVYAKDGIYRKLVLWGDRLIGAVLVGDVSDAGILASLIRRRIALPSLRRVDLRRPLRYADIMRL